MTSTSPTDDRKCRTCGQTWAWHEEHKPRHKFVDADSDLPDGLGPKAQKKGEKPAVIQKGWPSDPVLRIALVRKGILSMADIEAAEAELREAAGRGGGVVLYKRGDPAAHDGSMGGGTNPH